MNIQHLRHLLAVAKYGNLLVAARELNISQSGLSRSISGLESILGVQLFVRRARGVSLTDAGRDFLRRAQAILNEYERATEELNAVKDMRSGSMSIGINHSFAHYITPAVIVDILRKAANLEIHVATHNYYELIENLLANRYDFGMSVYFKSEMHTELTYEDLFPFESMVFCNTRHPLAKAKQVSAVDLSKERWALLEGKGAREGFEYFFRQHAVQEPPVALQSASLTLLANVVSQVDLLTVLPREVALVEFAEGRTLQMLKIGKPFAVAHYGLIYRTDSARRPIVDEFKKLLKDHATRFRSSLK